MAKAGTVSFKADLEKFGKLTEEKANELFRKIALDLFTSIIMTTPVDTGRARGNWFTTIGSPSGAVSERLGAGASTGEAQRVVKGAEIGETIWLANNLPYINRLENGWSKQAPPGAMVALNVARARSKYG